MRVRTPPMTNPKTTTPKNVCFEEGKPAGEASTMLKFLSKNMAIKVEAYIIAHPDLSVEECARCVWFTELKLQAGDTTTSNDAPSAAEDADTKFWLQVMKRFSAQSKYEGWDKITQEQSDEWVSDQVENLYLSYHYFKHSPSVFTWAQLVYKLFTKRSSTRALLRKWDEIFGADEANVQADVGDVLKFARKAFDLTTNLSDHPVLKKFTKLFNYMLVQGFLEKVGLKLSDEDYSRLEQRTLQQAFSGKRGLWIAALDVLLFLSEKIWEFSETKDISVFLHTSSEYADWQKECDRLMGLIPFVGNLEVHGTSYFQYVSDMSVALEKGESYIKYSQDRAGYESIYLKKRVSQLQLAKSTLVTRQAAQKDRKAPLGVLLHGRSGVAKSSFAKMLYYYYGALKNLPTDAHYIYSRNAANDYWDNFDTSMWCIQLDDIGFLLPAKAKDIDPTLKELLNVVNNVPYVPTQADLADKGKTPVRAELVLATSNCESLNAAEYFYCPLAVQRRLPFIVEITPKDEYLADNKKMIDSTKLKADASTYPDYWNITVKEIVPQDQGGREHAKVVVKQIYTDVNVFLADFGKVIMQHERNQISAMTCDTYMSNVHVCAKCFMPAKACSCMHAQAGDFFVPDVHWETISRHWYDPVVRRCLSASAWFFRMYIWIFMSVFQLRLSMYIMHFVLRYRVTKYVTYRFMMALMPATNQIPLLGLLNSVSTLPRRWAELSRTTRTVVLAFTGIVAAMSVGYITKSVITSHVKQVVETLPPVAETPKEEKKTDETSTKSVVVSEVPATRVVEEPKEVLTVQGNKFGTTEKQLLKEETNNVWYNPTLELTTFDIPPSSQCISRFTVHQVRDMLANNVVRVRLVGKLPGGVSTRTSSGIFVSGQSLLLNTHLFNSKCEEWMATIICSPECTGVNANITFRVGAADVVSLPREDLSMIKVSNLPPRKDIMKYWCATEIPVTRFCEVLRSEDGSVHVREVLGAHNAQCNVDEESMEVHLKEVPIIMGESDEETAYGDCGSPAVAMTPRGPCIYGTHLLGRDKACGAYRVTIDQIDRLRKLLALTQVIDFDVQGGGQPQMESHGVVRVLGPLHHKSSMRYLPNGKIHVFGTIEGFRPRPKSTVCDTPLRQEMSEHFQATCDHGKPAMGGWGPWNFNLKEMVQPTLTHDKSKFVMAAKGYLNDILTGLPEDWEKELVTLSRKAAVNGLPGVKYIDGLNRSSSMGHPWNCTKKRYLVSDADEDYPEGVTFDDEFWKEVDKIDALYKEGKRAYPVFSANLKDTPTPAKKIRMQKTRIFTGAPAPWCIAVRQRLLPFVRLLQKNTILFEAGPGTVCQSAEWGKIRKHLTSFGLDRMVAGDYGFFDKRMIAELILLAFQIIAAIHKKAGFSDEECREIMCIGYDTAFSWCNFNGDLVEFFGTNPSGHPLTVIINSIVNSLYIRYCYLMLNPGQECMSFKEFVHLFTYGDDNVMGVSPYAEWFNHTAMQTVLANIGVEYTMADKTSESRPFIHIDEVSFLKRIWRYDEDVQGWLCPLEEASIQRSLMVWLPSKTIDAYTQLVEVITSANNEFFFYGRERFEKEHAFFQSILARDPYCRIPKAAVLPTWQILADRWLALSKGVNEQEQTA